MTNFHDIEKTFLSLVVVALSEHIGTDENGKTYPSSKYLEDIDKVIKGTPNVIDSTEVHSKKYEKDEYEMELILESEDSTDHNLKSWAKSLCEKVKEIAQKCKSETLLNLNPYYSEKAAEAIKDLITFFPLWTCVMFPEFGINLSMRSSSAVEGQFSKMKKDGFERLPLRVDKFVLKHIAWLKCEVNILAQAMLDKDRPTLNRKTLDLDIFQDSLNVVENRRGKTQRSKQAAQDKADFSLTDGVSDEENSSVMEYSKQSASAEVLNEDSESNSVDNIADAGNNYATDIIEENSIEDSDKSPHKITVLYSSAVLIANLQEDKNFSFPISPIPHEDTTSEIKLGKFRSTVDSEPPEIK